MGFNREHYRKVWEARRNDDTPRYSFLYNRFISPDEGYRLKDHDLEGTEVTFGKEKKVYKIGSVHLHYYEGYFFHILAHDKNNSSRMFHININDTSGLFKHNECKIVETNKYLTRERCETYFKRIHE